MEHEQRMMELLRPLGVYDLGAGAVNCGELGSYGRELDLGLALLEETAREMSLATAEGVGLDLIESLLPYRPASGTTAERRQALAALLRIGGDSFTTPEAINDTLAGCGINARAAEGAQPGHVEVTFPDVMGVPGAFAEMRTIIEEILPCHLEVGYLFRYNSWEELAAKVGTWAGAAAAGKSWEGLSVWQI